MSATPPPLDVSERRPFAEQSAGLERLFWTDYLAGSRSLGKAGIDAYGARIRLAKGHQTIRLQTP